MADERAEALRRLEERLSEVSQRAERLIRETAEEPSEPPKPPPAGWQSPPDGHSPNPFGGELEALLSAMRSLRELVPPEVAQRLADALKEVLLALRGLIDYYIERLDRRREEPPEVEEIPIL